MGSAPEQFERVVQQFRRALQHRVATNRCCQQSRSMLRDSTWRIQRSRLVLDYPDLEPICGGSDPQEVIRQRVRDALASGALPPIDGNRSWAGRGTGEKCRVCDEPIGPDQIEHEVETPASVLVHQGCLIIWREESARTS